MSRSRTAIRRWPGCQREPQQTPRGDERCKRDAVLHMRGVVFPFLFWVSLFLFFFCFFLCSRGTTVRARFDQRERHAPPGPTRPCSFRSAYKSRMLTTTRAEKENSPDAWTARPCQKGTASAGPSGRIEPGHTRERSFEVDDNRVRRRLRPGPGRRPALLVLVPPPNSRGQGCQPRYDAGVTGRGNRLQQIERLGQHVCARKRVQASANVKPRREYWSHGQHSRVCDAPRSPGE